jgi:hypothetical protein
MENPCASFFIFLFSAVLSNCHVQSEGLLVKVA